MNVRKPIEYFVELEDWQVRFCAFLRKSYNIDLRLCSKSDILINVRGALPISTWCVDTYCEIKKL